MSDYRVLDSCENLKAIESCDVHVFRQFFEIERSDKKRRKATYTGNARNIAETTRDRRVSSYLDRWKRYAYLKDLLKDQDFLRSDLFQLASYEKQLGLPPSGKDSNPFDRRVDFLRGLERSRDIAAPAGRIGTDIPVPDLLALGKAPVSAFDVIKGLLGDLPLIPTVPAAEPLDEPIWAIGVDYEQAWCSLGYGRGRLVRSIPLTPSETLEIVTKTWNKRTDRRQTVDSIERDISTEFVGDEKWSLATRKEVTASLNGNVNGNVQQHLNISLPIEIVQVSAGSSSGIGGQVDGSFTETVSRTEEKVKQETFRAANRLKTTVTSTVETVAEVGREVTQTQQITNPNRCHSLTYHFFEVTEKYKIATKANQVALYLLVPLDRPTITFGWVLCHECELKPLLPCEVYYGGFQAAKLLKAREQLGLFLGTLETPAIEAAASTLETLLESIVDTYRLLSQAGLVSSDQGEGLITAVTGVMSDLDDFARNTANAVEDVAGAVVDAAQNAWDAIVETGSAIINGLMSPFRITPPGARAIDFPFAGEAGGGPGSFIYWEIVKVVAPELETALVALAQRHEEITNMTAGPEKTRAVFDALGMFFAQAGDVAAAFDNVNRVVAVVTFAAPAAVVIGSLGLLGLPGAALAALAALIGLGFAARADGVDAADLLPDDEGLEDLIRRANAQLQDLGSLAQLPPEPGPDASVEERARFERAVQELKRERREAAQARTEFDRLKCHLEENFDYYNQTLWQGKPAASIQQLLAKHHIPAFLVEQRISGFVRNRAAFKVNEEFLKEDFDWEGQRKDLKLDDLLGAKPSETEVEMPTPGMVVEPVRGACFACDEFIQKHRDLDIAARTAEIDRLEAEAAQAKLEAQRFEERIKKGELGDPTPFERADRLEVTVPAESAGEE